MEKEKIDSLVEMLLAKTDKFNWDGIFSVFECEVFIGGDSSDNGNKIKLSIGREYIYSTPFEGAGYIVLSGSGIGKIAQSVHTDEGDTLVMLYEKLKGECHIRMRQEMKEYQIKSEKKLELLISSVSNL